VTLPYLKARSVGGSLMLLGHLFFVTNFVCTILGVGPNRDSPALFHQHRARRVEQATGA
jgi:cytochrome c oxidase cbb3-type subunit 1